MNKNINAESNIQEADTMMNKTAENNNMEATDMMNETAKNNNMEATDMMNETNNNMDGVGTLGEVPFDDLAKIIPPNEQAVMERNNEQTKIEVVGMIEPLEDAMSEIPQDEREGIEEPPVELADITECGLFTPTFGMKGFITDTGHIFWGKLLTEPKTGCNLIYHQQYKDRTLSPQMRINKADLMLAAGCRFVPENITNRALRADVEKFIIETTKDYYNKLLYLNEGLDMVSILKLFTSEFAKLPFENKLPLLEQPKKLYSKVIQIIKDRHLDTVDEHEAYYTLDKNHIDTLAEDLNIKKNELLKKLKEYRFLYLTDSSEGYQTCIRFKAYGEFFPKAYTQWCYCILKLDYLAKKRLQRTNK